jgi:hypothetical protein
MTMSSGFHFHHDETWFKKKPGLTVTGAEREREHIRAEQEHVCCV